MPALFDVLVTPLMNFAGLARDTTSRHDGNVFEPQPAGDKIHGGWRRRGLRRGNVGAGGHHDPG
jgi:hypothetical protein